MRKKLAVIALAGIMTMGLTAGSVQAAEPDGEVYVFIAASLANAMEKIQKDFNQKYPDVEIFYKDVYKRQDLNHLSLIDIATIADR